MPWRRQCVKRKRRHYTARMSRAWMGVIILVGADMAAAQDRSGPVTFAKDIAPIVSARCLNCHREGGDAPFALSSLADVRQRAQTIRVVTNSRYMPPWKPEPGFGDFHGDRRLSDREIATIARWIDGGMPPGDARDLSPPERAGGWSLGPPDVIVRLPAYELRADGPDVFRNFVIAIPTGGSKDPPLQEPLHTDDRRGGPLDPPVEKRYVRGWQFRPGNAAVHHANIRIDPTPASRRLDEADSLPGYEGVILRSADFPDGHFLGWTPGQSLPALSDATAWSLDQDADFVVQLHLRPTGKVEVIAPVIGLYFGATAPQERPTMIRLGRQDLDIPAGAASHVVQDSFELPVDALAHAVQAHAHYRARSMHGWAELPDGTRRELLRIDDWDPAWQDRYQYRSPFWLPKGTTLRLTYTFDNSAGNPRNRQAPPQRAEWGWRTSDEMGDLWLQVTTRSESDREALTRIARRKMHTEDAIGCETLIAREPRRIDLRNDAASIYMALDKPADALRHFAAATRIEPTSAAAWFNEGVALEALGNRDAARTRYAEAIKLDPGYSAALNNLGSVLMREGRIDDARPEFERAVRADPRNAEARANLALALIGNGQPDAAIGHVDEALRLQPERASRLVQFVWLLSAAADPAKRRAPEGARIAEAIVAATGRNDARALDALGIAYASAGRFADAIAAANEALALATVPADAATEIRERIALYQSGKPFVLPR